jgi:hypothetical protein
LSVARLKNSTRVSSGLARKYYTRIVITYGDKTASLLLVPQECAPENMDLG